MGWSRFQVKIPKFYTPYGVYLILEAQFQFNIVSILAKTQFWAKLAEKPNFSIFETISGFFSCLRIDSNSTWKISKFLYPLFIFSQPPFTVSEENHLDFCENWVLTKFGWKIKILWFRNDFWVLFISSSGANINLPIFKVPFYFSSRVISISICEQARNRARGPKTQKFKVLCFEPNFRGR